MCEFATPLQIQMKTDDFIHILMRNMRLGLRVFLVSERFDDLPSMLTRCTGIEDNWRRNRYIPELSMGAKVGVNEIVEISTEYQYSTVGENTATIAEYNHYSQNLQSRGQSSKSGYSGSWNCGNVNHLFKLCTVPQKQIFCFECGIPDVLSPNCQICIENLRSGNLRGDPGRRGCPKDPSHPYPNQSRQKVAELVLHPKPDSTAHLE